MLCKVWLWCPGACNGLEQEMPFLFLLSVIFCSLSSWSTFGLSWCGCRLLASLLRAWVFDTGLQEEFKSSGIPTRQRPGFPWALSKGYFSAWSGNSKCAEEAHDTNAGRLHKGPTRKTPSWGVMQVLRYFYNTLQWVKQIATNDLAPIFSPVFNPVST